MKRKIEILVLIIIILSLIFVFPSILLAQDNETQDSGEFKSFEIGGSYTGTFNQEYYSGGALDFTFFFTPNIGIGLYSGIYKINYSQSIIIIPIEAYFNYSIRFSSSFQMPIILMAGICYGKETGPLPYFITSIIPTVQLKTGFKFFLFDFLGIKALPGIMLYVKNPESLFFGDVEDYDYEDPPEWEFSLGYLFSFDVGLIIRF